MVKINILKDGWRPNEIWNIIDNDLKKPGEFTYYFSFNTVKELLLMCNIKIEETLVFSNEDSKVEVEMKEVINKCISANGYRCFKLQKYRAKDELKYAIDGDCDFDSTRVLFALETENLNDKVDAYVLKDNQMI